MEQDLQNQIIELKTLVENYEQRIQELERYIQERKIQQISFPLDSQSVAIIKNL